jgi:predicted DNA-binding ribbon-helix-helix protein
MTYLQSRDYRSVRVSGRKTAIIVEEPIWHRFRVIAAERGLTFGALLAEIDRTYRLEPLIPGKRRVRSLSSAVRIFVFEQMEAAASDDAIERALAIAANNQSGNTPNVAVGSPAPEGLITHRAAMPTQIGMTPSAVVASPSSPDAKPDSEPKSAEVIVKDLASPAASLDFAVATVTGRLSSIAPSTAECSGLSPCLETVTAAPLPTI